MDWTQIIIALISAIAGGGLCGLLTIRQKRRDGNAEALCKEVDASSKQNQEWQEIVSEYREQAKQMTELRNEVNDLHKKVNQLYTNQSIALRFYCDKVNCKLRRPPFGTATEQTIQCLILKKSDDEHTSD